MQIIALDKPFIYNLLLWIQFFGRGDGRLFCRFKHSLPLLPFLFPFLGKRILLTAADDTTLANTFATHLAHSKSCVLAANFPKGPSKASGWGGETKTVRLPSGSLPSSCLSSPY